MKDQDDLVKEMELLKLENMELQNREKQRQNDEEERIRLKIQNKKEGEGIFYFSTGLIAYKGNWANDLYDGEGQEFNKESRDYSEPWDGKDFAQIENHWVNY